MWRAQLKMVCTQSGEVNRELLALDPQLPESLFPLAEYRGGLMIVNVPEGAAGEVMLDGQVYALAELAAAGNLHQGRHHVHALCVTTQGTLSTENRCQFFCQLVPAPAKIGLVPLIHTIDPQFLRYLFVGTATCSRSLDFGVIPS